MKKYILIFIATMLSGCSSVGSYQQDCETRYAEFESMVTCLKSEVLSDSRMRGDARVKLYLLKADQLVGKFKLGEINETDARVGLQEIYLSLKNQETNEREKQELIQALTKPIKTDTTCISYGNSANCTTRQD